MELKISNLVKDFGARRVLDHVSVTMQPGIYGLIGENGAGKSTFINILTGNLEATSGSITWKGKSIDGQKRGYLSCIGYAPQVMALYPEFTAREYFDYICALKDVPKKKREDQITEILVQTDMKEWADEKIKFFSGGMKQRVLLGQAFIGNPQILILDEPMNGLDPKQRIQIRDYLKLLSKEKIVLVSTHIVSDIEAIEGNILLLRKGKLNVL